MTIERLFWLVLSAAAVASLLAFAAKRAIYLVLAALYRPGESGAPAELPRVAVLIPCRNEAKVLESSMKATANLDYPADRIRVIYIDDSSTDGTAEILAERSGELGFEWFRVETGLERGKAHALNEALKRIGDSELIYILDADFEPAPDALRRGVEFMQANGLDMVTGRLVADAPLRNPVASYAAIEELVHQHITQAAQSALGLGSAPMGGNYIIRSATLKKLGGFDESALLEDVDLALKLFERAHKSRFLPQMAARHSVPKSARTFTRQHYFWARGFHQATKKHIAKIAASKNLNAAKRYAAIFFCLGYADRPAILLGAAASIGTATGANPFFPLWIWLAVFALPAAHAVVAALKEGDVRRLAGLLWLPVVFPLDIWAATKAFFADLAGLRLGGYKTERE